MFTITLDQLPKVVKDVPWFLQSHSSYHVDDIDDLKRVKSPFIDFLTMAKSEPEAIMFVEWLCEYSNAVGIDASRHDAFTVYINRKKLPKDTASEQQFMKDTMPDLLANAFEKQGII